MSEKITPIKDKEKISFIEFFNQSVCEMGSGYIVVMMTDNFAIQKLEQETFDRDNLYNKALEIRMFNQNCEKKWFRTSIGVTEFQYRERNDAEIAESEYWDEEQYLDIAEGKSDISKGIAHTRNGGAYPLPIEKYEDTKIVVRNYLSYENRTGQLTISDWRLVKFK